MKKAFSVLTVLVCCVGGCSDSGIEPGGEVREVVLSCIDLVTVGGTLQTIINSQRDYDQLIFDRFTKPLQDYWNANYASILQSVQTRYPGLTDQQYADSVREIFYSVYPFRGTDNCSHPIFDFRRYTLLGQDSHGSGCQQPDIVSSISRNDETRTIVFKVRVLQRGSCDMVFHRNTWMLIPKLPEGYIVTFLKEYSQD